MIWLGWICACLAIGDVGDRIDAYIDLEMRW